MSRLVALVLICVLALTAASGVVRAQGRLPVLHPLDAKGRVTYVVADGTPNSGFRPSDRDLAVWALKQWQHALDGALHFEPSAEKDAMVRVFWVPAGEGRYGEMRAFQSGTLRGAPDHHRFAYRFIYSLKNFVHSSRLHPGSSGVILCWKEHFVRVGGFDEGLEVRENSELMKRLKRFGRYRYIGDITARTSMRRYQHKGVRRLAWLWTKLWVQSLFGDLHD